MIMEEIETLSLNFHHHHYILVLQRLHEPYIDLLVANSSDFLPVVHSILGHSLK